MSPPGPPRRPTTLRRGSITAAEISAPARSGSVPGRSGVVGRRGTAGDPRRSWSGLLISIFRIGCHALPRHALQAPGKIAPPRPQAGLHPAPFDRHRLDLERYRRVAGTLVKRALARQHLGQDHPQKRTSKYPSDDRPSGLTGRSAPEGPVDTSGAMYATVPPQGRHARVDLPVLCQFDNHCHDIKIQFLP